MPTYNPDDGPSRATSGPLSSATVQDAREQSVPDRAPSVKKSAEQAGTRFVDGRAFHAALAGDTPHDVPPKKLSPAEWVKAVRRALGLTQEKFAAKLEVDRSAVAKWETALARPRYDSIEKIKAVAPLELKDVGLIQDESLPEEDDGEPEVSPSTISLIHAIDSWADRAGVKRPTEDNEFFDRLIVAYTEWRKRLARGAPK